MSHRFPTGPLLKETVREDTQQTTMRARSERAPVVGAEARSAVLVAAGVLASGTGIANAATARHQTTASPTVVSTGATLPANIIADATPYVVASGHHATVEAAAKQHLTAAEYTAVIQSVARFNSEPATLANTATKFGVSSSSAVAVHSNAVSPMDGCAWSWNWTSHWYGWTFWMNDCAVNVIIAGLLYAVTQRLDPLCSRAFLTSRTTLRPLLGSFSAALVLDHCSCRNRCARRQVTAAWDTGSCGRPVSHIPTASP